MSHLSVSKIKVKNPNAELLKKVVEQVAIEMKGQLVSSIDIWGRPETNFLVAFKTSEIPRGVGVRITDGQVEIVGDLSMLSYDVRKRLEAELTKNYTAAAINQTLRKMGYQVQTRKAMQKVILLAEH